MKRLSSVIILCILIIAGVILYNLNRPNKSKTFELPSYYSKELVRPYEIVAAQDISIKALERPLSSYSLSELNRLPTNIRKKYGVVVPTDISKEEMKSTLVQVILNIISENPDIDEIAIFAYDNKNDVGDFYTFGKAEWCPNGKWAGVTERIASTNDRTSYKINLDITNRVGAHLNTEETDSPVQSSERIKKFEVVLKKVSSGLYIKVSTDLPDGAPLLCQFEKTNTSRFDALNSEWVFIKNGIAEITMPLIDYQRKPLGKGIYDVEIKFSSYWFALGDKVVYALFQKDIPGVAEKIGKYGRNLDTPYIEIETIGGEEYKIIAYKNIAALKIH